MIATDIDEATLAGLAGCTHRRLDVTDPAAIAAFAAEVGRASTCCSTAPATSITAPSSTARRTDWTFSMDLNVRSMYRLIRALLPAMLTRGGGSIVNMSSVASSVKGVPNRFVYGACKAAVIGLTKAVAMDFVGRGIRCNAICPGTVETPSLDDRMRAQGDYEAARKAFVARQPMGRLGNAAGDRESGLVPVFGRKRLHDRRHSRYRRRHDLLTNRGKGAASR